MDKYRDIDKILVPWTSRHGFKLFNEFNSLPRRFFYVTGGLGESFQISVEPPELAGVTVNLWSVETADDADLHESWICPTEQLEFVLDAAIGKIDEWKGRSRKEIP